MEKEKKKPFQYQRKFISSSVSKNIRVNKLKECGLRRPPGREQGEHRLCC